MISEIPMSLAGLKSSVAMDLVLDGGCVFMDCKDPNDVSTGKALAYTAQPRAPIRLSLGEPVPENIDLIYCMRSDGRQVSVDLRRNRLILHAVELGDRVRAMFLEPTGIPKKFVRDGLPFPFAKNVVYALTVSGFCNPLLFQFLDVELVPPEVLSFCDSRDFTLPLEFQSHQPVRVCWPKS